MVPRVGLDGPERTRSLSGLYYNSQCPSAQSQLGEGGGLVVDCGLVVFCGADDGEGDEEGGVRRWLAHGGFWGVIRRCIGGCDINTECFQHLPSVKHVPRVV